MAPGVADVVALPVVLAVGVGPLAAVIALLNLRDRRQARVLAATMAQFSSEALRSDVVIRVRCRLFRPGAEVGVDMGPCSDEELWGAMVRLRRHLPASVRLRVEGRVARELPTRFTVELVGRERTRSAGTRPRALAPSC